MSYLLTKPERLAAAHRLQELMVIAESAESREEAQAAIREADAVRYAIECDIRPGR